MFLSSSSSSAVLRHLTPKPSSISISVPDPNLSPLHLLPRKRNRIPIEITPLLRAGDLKKSGGEVCVRGYGV